MFADDQNVLVLFIGFRQPCGVLSRQAGPAEEVGGRGGVQFPAGPGESQETGRGETSGSQEETAAPAPGQAGPHHSEQAAETGPDPDVIQAQPARAGGEESPAELRERGGQLPDLPGHSHEGPGTQTREATETGETREAGEATAPGNPGQ